MDALSFLNYSIDAQHKKKDEQVTLAASKFFAEKQELSELDCALLLGCIIKHAEGKLRAAFLDIEMAMVLIRENPKLKSALEEAWRTKDYKEIRKSKLLTMPKRPPDDHLVEQKRATENSWTVQFRGEASMALWTQIKESMKQADKYTRYLEIVQSSGTGKSRMVDELSKTHLVIPINLRSSSGTGYPPSDLGARACLSRATNKVNACVHAVAFLWAVFDKASKLITELRKPLPEGMDCHDKIVVLFNEYMSEGMRWGSHGDKRQSFYDEARLSAMELERKIERAFATNKKNIDDKLASVGIREAFKNLVVTLSSVHTSPCFPQAIPEPLVILAFDEASVLKEPHYDVSWSCFSELLRVLRALNDQPLFSLFLSTGNVNPLVPPYIKQLSPSMQRQILSASPRFIEVGFDHFAFKDQFNLRAVAEDEHICHFGRPLWATRYEKGDDDIRCGIIQFAALKLRAGKLYLTGDRLNDTEKLACLAQRLPIEFHSVTYASKINELQLVEGHMRILLQLDAESLTTASSSEPLLSEAAYWMMNSDTTFKAAETLKSCLEGYAIRKGNHGELLVMLLFILARDRAIGHPDHYGRPISGQRWCTVPDFMNALFKFTRHPGSDALLEDLFAKSKIFFSHWVKVHECAIMNVRYLAQLMRRGVALLCATNHVGIDGIVPFLLAGYTIFPKNIGVILMQIKNDPTFIDKPDPSLFKAMDPYQAGILSPGDNIPIIRIIFTLASKTPCLTRVTCQQDGLKSCDFWVGGISPTVFSPVCDHDADIWIALLQATRGWEDVYKNNSEGSNGDEEECLLRSMNPGAADDDCHWENWVKLTEDENEEDVGMDED